MTIQCNIVNKYHEPYDILITRPTIFGNPFKSGRDGTRTEVIAAYEMWLITKLKEPEFLAEFMKLTGKTLGCVCKPKKCHGDIIVKHVNRLNSPLIKFFG